jgi:hypothetical protein
MILLISLIIFIAWLLLGYFLLKKPPAEFLSRRKRILLYAATLVTAGLFVHDYLYDKGSTPLIYEQVFCEIILSGTIYVGLIFVLGYAFDAWINKRAWVIADWMQNQVKKNKISSSYTCVKYTTQQAYILQCILGLLNKYKMLWS